MDIQRETVLEGLLVRLHDQARVHALVVGEDGASYARGLRDAADQLAVALQESRRVSA